MGGKFPSCGEALNLKTAQFFTRCPLEKCKMLMKQSLPEKQKELSLRPDPKTFQQKLSRVLRIAARIKITELGELDPSLKDTRADCPRNCVGRDLSLTIWNFRISVEYSNVTDTFCVFTVRLFYSVKEELMFCTTSLTWWLD